MVAGYIPSSPRCLDLWGYASFTRDQFFRERLAHGRRWANPRAKVKSMSTSSFGSSNTFSKHRHPHGSVSSSVALPLISTEGGGFDVDEVASVAVAAALDFLQSPSKQNHEGLCIVLAAEDGSRALEALQKYVPRLARESGERRLVVRACALPDVARAGPPCSYIVNPCNWRLAEGGGRTNVLVHRAAGDCLRRASLTDRTRAFVAEPFPVEIPLESPLRAKGGVQTVIQVLGPNLDPRFPDCLDDKPEEARRLLRVAYDRALECFWDLTTRSAPVGGDGSSISSHKPTLNDETVSRGSKRLAGDPTLFRKRMTGVNVSTRGGGDETKSDASTAAEARGEPRIVPEVFATYKRDPPVPMPTSSGAGRGGWRGVLYCFLQEPRSSAAQAEIFYEDELCVVAYDGHPKSRFHLLLLPKQKVLDVKTPSALRKEHLPVLRRLHTVGNAVAQDLMRQGAGAVRCGYHSIPSLQPLHLHIISQDFDSPGLKKKNHLNSFTTDFFLSSSWVEARLGERGHLDLDRDRYKKLEAHPLRCFRCDRGMSNMKAFKAHNRTCPKLASET